MPNKKKVAKKKVTEPKVLKSDIRSVGKYALLLTQKIESEAALKKLTQQITELTPSVLDYFQRQSIDQVSVGGRILYLRRELHTTKSSEWTTNEACEYLTSIGLDDYVGEKVNTQGLGAWVREKEQDGEKLDDILTELGGRFNIVELYKIGSRKR